MPVNPRIGNFFKKASETLRLEGMPTLSFSDIEKKLSEERRTPWEELQSVDVNP